MANINKNLPYDGFSEYEYLKKNKKMMEELQYKHLMKYTKKKRFETINPKTGEVWRGEGIESLAKFMGTKLTNSTKSIVKQSEFRYLENNDPQWIYEIRDTYTCEEENDYKNNMRLRSINEIKNNIKYINKKIKLFEEYSLENDKSKIIELEQLTCTIDKVEQYIYYKILLLKSYKKDLEDLLSKGE